MKANRTEWIRRTLVNARRRSALRFVTALTLLALGAPSAFAQIWYYSAMDANGNMTPQFSIFPPESYHALYFTPPVTGRKGCYYESAVLAGMGFAIQLADDTDDGSGGPAVYQLQVAFAEAFNFSRDIVHALSVSSGSRLDRNFTTAYQSAANLWQTACFVTNDVGILHPTVTFSYQSGTVSGTSRVFADLFRFVKFQPAPIPAPTLNLSLGAGGFVLSWSTNSPGFGLFGNDNLASTDWVAVTNTPVVTNGQNQVIILNPLAGSGFYRLQSR